MGRPPNSGGPVFRFTQNEVAQMEGCLQDSNNAVPTRELISYLAEKFSASTERTGKSIVQTKQVWNWFQNRRYAQRTKMTKAPAIINMPPTPQEDSVAYRNVANSLSIAPVNNSSSNTQLEFEAKSSRDGAWYDVSSFLSHRMFETGDPEVRVRFTGFGIEEDEWINIRKCVRPRSLPCEPSECVAVLSGDLILCFQEDKDQALYFDAHVLDAQRRRHDIRGCRCRFLVRYDHDQSEEIVPLRKICRRPETDYRLQILHASKGFGPIDTNMTTNKLKKQQKIIDVSIEEASPPVPQSGASTTVDSTATVTDSNNALVPNVPASDVAMTCCSGETFRE